VTLPDPAGLILAAAVLQVEHGIPQAGLSIVVRRRIDQGVSPSFRLPSRNTRPPGRRRGEHPVADSRSTRFGDFDSACVFASAEVGMASGIAEFRAVDQQSVVMEARHERRGGGGPEAVRLLLHVQLRALQKFTWTLVAPGAFTRNSALPAASTRGYAAPHTLVDAGSNPPGFCAQQKLDSRSIAIPILFIKPLHPESRPRQAHSREKSPNCGPTGVERVARESSSGTDSLGAGTEFPDHWNGTRSGFSKNSRIS
jgi:hypothetical protein